MCPWFLLQSISLHTTAPFGLGWNPENQPLIGTTTQVLLMFLAEEGVEDFDPNRIVVKSPFLR